MDKEDKIDGSDGKSGTPLWLPVTCLRNNVIDNGCLDYKSGSTHNICNHAPPSSTQVFSSTMVWSLISPASRGIGFALTRQALRCSNAPVVATARKDLDKTKEELLNGLDVDEKWLTVLRLDVLGTKNTSYDRKPGHAHYLTQLIMLQLTYCRRAKHRRRRLGVQASLPLRAPPTCLRPPRHSLPREVALANQRR